MPYTYVISLARYRDNATGRFISASAVRGYLDDGLSQSSDVAGDLTRSLLRNEISVNDWHSRMRQEIKDEYVRQYLLGRGGLNNMAQEDWGRVGGIVKTQYQYLDAFRDELRAATLSELPEDGTAARARMYTNSARQSYERAYARSIADGDAFAQERWYLGATERHCSDCIDLSARGWVDIGELGTYPCAGATQCLSNCDCRIGYK